MADSPDPHSHRRRGLSGRHHHVPPGTGTLGMYLLLAALGMLFASSVLAYILLRTGAMLPEGTAARLPPLGAIHMPLTLWLSTALILLSSYSMHRALDNLRHERQTQFRSALTLTLLLGAGFLLVQVPSLGSLLHEHLEIARRGEDLRLYGLVFFFILVHGLHVLGGIIPLGITTFRAHRDAYDHERFQPVQYIAMYWHFLDVVWLVMFAVFLALG